MPANLNEQKANKIFNKLANKYTHDDIQEIINTLTVFNEAARYGDENDEAANQPAPSHSAGEPTREEQEKMSWKLNIRPRRTDVEELHERGEVLQARIAKARLAGIHDESLNGLRLECYKRFDIIGDFLRILERPQDIDMREREVLIEFFETVGDEVLTWPLDVLFIHATEAHRRLDKIKAEYRDCDPRPRELLPVEDLAV